MGGMAAESIVNLPVQMLSLVDRDGRQTPVRFRDEDEEHRIFQVKIVRILSREKISLAGVREIRVCCAAAFGERERLLELRYGVDSQRGRIFRSLS